MRTLTLAAVLGALHYSSAAAEKVLALKDLPPVVQQAVQEQVKGGQVTSISKEKENGVTVFDVEWVLNGKHREFDVDMKGKLLSQEQEISMDSIPARAREAILKRVGTGQLGTVMLAAEGGQTLYEAAYTTPKGKKREVTVRPDGIAAK